MQVVVKDLSYIYSEKSKDLRFVALKGVSLNIGEGEFFGIIGKTGSGKSTFVQHLNGLIIPQKDRGSITVGGFNLTEKDCDFNLLRSKVGMVFQYPEHQLFAETVKDDVCFGLDNFCHDLPDTEKQEKIKNAITLVGLDYEKIKDKSPFDLSGGQKRRIAIAGVIVSEPEVLVLDEPAAGLDPKGKKEFIELLKNLHKTFVKTIIIVSHDMDLIAENCSKACVFKDGEIISVGTPKDIFANKELIDNAGLELPLTAYLTEKLKMRGIVIDSDFTVQSFIDGVKNACLKKGGKQ